MGGSWTQVHNVPYQDHATERWARNPAHPPRPPRRDRGRETEEEQDLRNERIGDLFILPILLWLRAETAQCTEEEQDLRNDRMWCVRDPGV